MKESEKLLTNIFDVVYDIDDILDFMRSGDGTSNSFPVVQSLVEQIGDYFLETNIDEIELKIEAARLTDRLYREAMFLSTLDRHTMGYFKFVLGKLYIELAKKNILIFSIVDNTIKDDRFKLLLKLFEAMDFEVVCPYMVGDLQHSSEITRLPTRDYKEVQDQIVLAAEEKKHIIYVEKDASVDYLKKVLYLAEDFQGGHLCIFRNKSFDEQELANVLMGGIGDFIK